MDALQTLSELYAQRDLLNSEIETKRREILRAVQAELDALEEETAPMIEAISNKIATAEVQAKEAVIQKGESVKGYGLHLVYTQGRVTWETKILDWLVAFYPEIGKARKVGAASVSIRRAA